MDEFWAITGDIAGGVGIPAAAIIISTYVAVRLARNEREAAATARLEERAQTAADRLEDRTEDAFVRTLLALATLNTINLRSESIAEPLRELRVGLTLLVTAASEHPEVVGQWFEMERMAGASQSEVSMSRIAQMSENLNSQNEATITLWACEPINEWARDFANNLRIWRRGEMSEPAMRELSQAAWNRIVGE